MIEIAQSSVRKAPMLKYLKKKKKKFWVPGPCAISIAYSFSRIPQSAQPIGLGLAPLCYRLVFGDDCS